MRTRLQADVGGAAARGRPGHPERHHLGVRRPGTPMPSFAHDGTGGVHDHRTHPGIGVGLHAPPRQLEGAADEDLIGQLR